MNGAAHLTLTASQLARQRGYFLTTLWDHTTPEQLNCPAYLGAGSVDTSHPHMTTLEEIPLPSGLRFLSPLPRTLEFDGFRMRDSAAGSSFTMTAGPADQ